MMLVLIDESGCPGFKLVKNSSPFFTIGMVIFSDFSEAEKVSHDIANLRNKLRIKEEFKFSKAHPNVKDEFFNAVCAYDFLIQALVVDKRNIYDSNFRKDNEAFYSYCLRKLVQNDDGLLRNARIKIDGVGRRAFRIALRKHLQNHLGTQKIASLKFVDSKGDSLIQLADMVVGAIARANDDTRKNHKKWLDVLMNRKKIANIWSLG
jgi:hypothetical protein